MSHDFPAGSRRVARATAVLAMAALALCGVSPAAARGSDGDITSPPTLISDAAADQPSVAPTEPVEPSELEPLLSPGASGTWFLLPSEDAQTSGSDSGGSQASNPAQSSSTNPSPPSSEPPQKHRSLVNPVTGLVSTSASGYKPLTGDERWRLYFKMNYWSVGAYFGPCVAALVLDHATDSPAQWGGGFAGYGRRVASRIGSAILQGTFQAPTAYVLHEDVRYISSGQGGFKHRAWHAVVYSFLTYNNQGHPTLNIANLGGYYASTVASNLWLPSHNNLLTYTLSNGTEQIGLSIPINILQEFWPEISHAFHRH